MKDYIAALDKIIQAPEDVIFAAPIITELRSDRCALQELLNRYFLSMQSDLDRYPREVSGNFVSFLPIDLREPYTRRYGFGLSYHEDTPNTSIGTHQSYTVLTPLNREIDVDFFEQPIRWDPDQFAPGSRIKWTGSNRYAPGNVALITPDSLIHSIRFSGPTVLLKVQSEVVVPFEWSFDKETLEAWQTISTVQMDTTCLHLCLRAQLLNDLRLVSPLFEMLEHERHFVRWAAAQALCACDSAIGIGVLKRLLGDPHPNIAMASQRALDALGERI